MVRVVVGLGPIPACIGQRQEHTLHRLPIHSRAILVMHKVGSGPVTHQQAIVSLNISQTCSTNYINLNMADFWDIECGYLQVIPPSLTHKSILQHQREACTLLNSVRVSSQEQVKASWVLEFKYSGFCRTKTIISWHGQVILADSFEVKSRDLKNIHKINSVLCA